jgi:hypothetical protein
MKTLLFLLIAVTAFAQVKVSELDTVTTTTTTDRFLYTVGNTSKAISYYRLGLRFSTYGAIADSFTNRVNTWGVQTINGLKTFGDGFVISSGGSLGVPIGSPSVEGRLARSGDSLMYRNSTQALTLADKQFVRSLRYGNVLPLNSVGTATDNTYNLGSRTVRWDTVYTTAVSSGGGVIQFEDPVQWRGDVTLGDSTRTIGSKIATDVIDSVYVKNIYSPSGGGLRITAPSGIVLKNIVYADELFLPSWNIGEATFDGGSLNNVTKNITYINVGECSVDVIPITSNPEWEVRGGGTLTIINVNAGVTTFIDSGTSGGAGSLNLAGNFAMALDGVLVLHWNRNASRWVEVSRSNN